MGINGHIILCEDYVSFEIAKLLKEKGFDEKVHTFYISETEIVNTNIKHNYNGESIYLSAPTYQMAMKWLREVHNLHIEIYRTACGYQYIVSNIPYGTDLYTSRYEGDDGDSKQFTTNEKAVEAAIKYCLENLI